jgi:hypothetical protein
MASTSKFLQLTPQILVEYIYRDPLAPEVIDTDTNGARIHILNDTYTNTNFLFNEDNPYTYTGNTRVLSAIPITADKSKYAYLTTNTALQYLDYDPNLIDTAAYQAQLTGPYNIPAKSIEYDTIKVHLISGFDFFDNDGILFEVLIRDRSGVKHNLASLAYLRADNYEINNPKPLIIGERLYTKYLLLKVPSLDWMTDEYLSAPNNTGILANQLTSNMGLLTQSTIELTAKFISRTEKLNAQTYFYIGESSSASINKTDEYSLLNAVVQESEGGDYFELYGEYGGDIYEDFIFKLNQMPNTSIIVMHEINVFEQVGTSFLLTTEQTFIQSNDFGEPYVFRPVILNSHVAVSYRIDYSLRLINKVDNTQVIKQAQFASFDVKKYGRRIRKINMGTVPTVTKVYNVLPSEVSQITLNNPAAIYDNTGTGKLIKETQFVMGFRERLKVSASVSTVKATPSTLQEGDIVPTASGARTTASNPAIEIKALTPTDKVWPLGEAAVSLSPFDNFILFVLYDNTLQEATGAKQPQLLDLTNMGTFYLSFKDESTGEEVRVSNYTNVKDLSPIKGELLFKVTKEEAGKIINFNSRNFYISSRLELNDAKSDETLVYFGKWYKIDEQIQTRDSEIIAELNKQIASSSIATVSELEALNLSLTTLKAQNVSLTDENNNLKRSLSQASEMLAQYNITMSNTIKGLLSGDTKAISMEGVVSANMLNVSNKISTGTEQFISQKTFNSMKGENIKNIKL